MKGLAASLDIAVSPLLSCCENFALGGNFRVGHRGDFMFATQSSFSRANEYDGFRTTRTARSKVFVLSFRVGFAPPAIP